MRIALHGGWGHDNLGDEAILAGYLSHFDQDELVVSSPDPAMTARAQNSGVAIVREGNRGRTGFVNLMAGGGYLNGAWSNEIPAKVRRMARSMGDARTVIHAVEVRNWSPLGGRSTRHVRDFLGHSAVSVRDAESAAEVQRLGAPAPAIVPDSIALLFPKVDTYVRRVPELQGRVVLNLLDIASRGDRDESSFTIAEYDRLAAELVERLGQRAVGLVVGAGDREYMERFRSLELVTPSSVEHLVSILGAASSVVSVRMHPALIGSMLGKPTLAIPYCGKVAPTLKNIGISEQLLTNSDPDFVMDHLDVQRTGIASAWGGASHATSRWLDGQLGDLG